MCVRFDYRSKKHQFTTINGGLASTAMLELNFPSGEWYAGDDSFEKSADFRNEQKG